MSKEKNTEPAEVKKDAKKKVDVQKFVQNKLRTLNQKNGGRYERDAARVVQNNL